MGGGLSWGLRSADASDAFAVLRLQVWFQNRRSKERRMKQLSALGARRHAFFRGPRRMRTLGGRLEDPDILGPGAYGYYGGKMAAAPGGGVPWRETRRLRRGAGPSIQQEQICIKLIHLLGFRTLTLKKKKQTSSVAPESQDHKAWSSWILQQKAQTGSEVLIKTKVGLVPLQVALAERSPSLKRRKSAMSSTNRKSLKDNLVFFFFSHSKECN